MNTQEKALAQLKSNGIDAKIENDTVYVCVGDSQFEISEFEINFQAKLYDEANPPAKRKFKVQAECITYCYIVVEATSADEANDIARDIDGGDFVTTEDGDWNILNSLTQETEEND